MRAAPTILGMAVAVLAFCLLRTVVAAWYAGATVARARYAAGPGHPVFFDRSVFEVFADGHVITSRYFSAAPEKMTIQNRARNAFTAWKLGSIWN